MTVYEMHLIEFSQGCCSDCSREGDSGWNASACIKPDWFCGITYVYVNRSRGVLLNGGWGLVMLLYSRCGSRTLGYVNL